MKIKLTLVYCLILLLACSKSEDTLSSSDSDCKDTNCSDYVNQAQAQVDFLLNPDCRADLDHDKDGIACEEPNNLTQAGAESTSTGGSTSGGCPTTANCGCSNKNKAPCQSSPCCRWIVGTGCKCS